MPRNLAPSLIAFTHQLHKGALILLPPPSAGASSSSGSSSSSDVSLSGSEMLRFQYNPETITRTRGGAWESRKNSQGQAKNAAPPTSAQERTSAAFRGGGLFAKSETIAMKLVFDATELLIDPKNAGKSEAERALGILPELGVLEQMAIAAPPDDKAKPAGSTKLTEAPPKELLLVLNQRVFPVIITQMTITEKRFSAELVPLRAEVDLQMQVMEATEVAGHPATKSAYLKLLDERLKNAKRAAETPTSLSVIQAALVQNQDGSSGG